MEIKEIQRNERKNVSISLRITKKHSEFMREKNISPTALFIKALDKIMLQNITK